MGNNKIKSVAISGAGGFIGSHLSGFFRKGGYKVIPLPREYFTEGGCVKLRQAVDGCDAVINLAGAPINRRWTEAYKKELFESRMDTTRRLVEAISAAAVKPGVFLSASAVGYYGTKGCNTESHYTKGSGFLSDLCQAWEGEATKAAGTVRAAVMRFGVVLAPDGGAFPLMAMPAKFKTAAVFGSGNQYFPWIDLRDLAGAVKYIMDDGYLDGVFNFVSPRVTTNAEFMYALAAAHKTWLTVKIPHFVFKAALGEAASFILSGQCVGPEKLLCAGYRFLSPDIYSFLVNLEKNSAL